MVKMWGNFFKAISREQPIQINFKCLFTLCYEVLFWVAFEWLLFYALHVDVNLADGSYVLVPEADITEQEEEVEGALLLEETSIQDPNLSSSLSATNPAVEGKPRFFLHNPNFKLHFYEWLCLCTYVLGVAWNPRSALLRYLWCETLAW